MAFFEIYIPTPGGQPKTVNVEGRNWLEALKKGLEAIGEEGIVKNVMCDIKDDGSIHVTDPKSGRVFRLKQTTTPPQPQPKAPPTPSQAPSVPPSPPPTPSTKTQPAPEKQTQLSPPPVVQKIDIPAPKQQPPQPPPPTPQPQEPPSIPQMPKEPSKKAATTAPATPQTAPPEPPAPQQPQMPPEPSIDIEIGRKVEKIDIDEVLSDIFMDIQDIYSMSYDQALNTVMDMAMKYIASESGTIFTADINHPEEGLRFYIVRGPKADQLAQMDIKIQMGVGIVGFCAQEGVSLAVSDVHRDPRFFKEISEKLGYETRSIICAPIEKDGRCLGAIELVNKIGGSSYSIEELNILEYIASQTAEYLYSKEQERLQSEDGDTVKLDF